MPSTTKLYSKLSVDLYDEKKTDMVNFFKDRRVALAADETTDVDGRPVLQVILYNLGFDVDRSPKLIDTVFLEKVDHSTVSKAVIESLSAYNVINNFL